MSLRIYILLMLATLLEACNASVPESSHASAQADTRSVVPAAEARSISQTSNNQAESSTMQKKCAGAELQLIVQGLPSPQGAQSTALQMVTPEGKTVDIRKPNELSEYTAVGLGCVTSQKDSRPYFVVQYGELPSGCSFCEWYYLYDAQGKQLTRSEPPLLEDETLPNGDTQYPNNQEFEALMQKLGIKQPEITYVK